MPTTRSARLSLIAISAAALALFHAGCSGAEKHPNVLLVSIDMLRPDHLHCYGYGQETSPNIDALAREGLTFGNHFASSSWTLPSHAAIFTSLPDSLHGCTDTDKRLDPSAVTLAERFQNAGYATAGFFSGPYLHPAFGLGQGFERYEDCASYAAKIDGRPATEWAMDKDVMVESHKDVTNERVYGAVKKWLDARPAKPFFLFAHFFDVHFDFTPPPPFDKKFDPTYVGWVDGKNFLFSDDYAKDMPSRDFQHLLSLYDGEIAWTDSFIGRIRADLEKAGILDDTVIAITSDHGTEFFEHDDKGHRKTLWDEVIRTPLILRYPKKLPSGKRSNELSRGIDVGPTLLELAGFPAPTDVFGTSLMPLVKNPGGHVVGRAISELSSVGHNLRIVRTLKWMLLDKIGTPEHWYFDLQRDPLEMMPMSDFKTELGKRAEAGYEEEIDALNAFAAQHGVPVSKGAGSTDLPEDVQKKLNSLGYTGASPGGSTEDGKPPPPPPK
jgi:arylsulfatase A-like enzyme